MSIHSAWQGTLGFFGRLPIVVETSQAQLSTDGGLLPIRQFDEQIGLTAALAEALADPRDKGSVSHSFLEMTRARIYGIIAGYEDQNDHDTLRSDPIFKLVAGRSPCDDDLASQPTLSRFENSINIPSLKRLKHVFMDQFLSSFLLPPRRLVIDIDAVDDPAHGEQQLTFWHGYYGQRQYLPLVITCADNDQTMVVALRPGNAHTALAADKYVAYITERIRAVWPDVEIVIRGDAGFGVPWMYAVCERLSLTYMFGLTSNNALKKRTESLLAEAVRLFEETSEPQRLFTAFGYRAKSWPVDRWVIAKVEVNAQGTNQRFVVTNRPGATVLPEAAYDDYAERGESENRNKELKRGLAMDRLSDHRFCANLFRLYLHAAAMNLLVRLRRQIADPPLAADTADVPIQALAGDDRRRYFQQRRQRDPLGEGQPCTWRMLLIKVAAEVTVTCRRIVIRLSASWPYHDYYRRVCQSLNHPLPTVAPDG